MRDTWTFYHENGEWKMGICVAKNSASKSVDFMRNKQRLESELIEKERMESDSRFFFIFKGCLSMMKADEKETKENNQVY